MDKKYTSINSYDMSHHKAAARRLKVRMADLGHAINLAHAYEAVAAVAGHSNWSTMIAVETRQTVSVLEDHPVSVGEAIEDQFTALLSAVIKECDGDGKRPRIPFGMKYYWVRHQAADMFVKLHNSPAGVLDKWPELTKEAFNHKDIIGGSFEHVIERAVFDLLMRKMEPLCEPYMTRDLDGKVAQIFLAALVFQWAAEGINRRVLRLQDTAFTAQGAASVLWEAKHASIWNSHPTNGTMATILTAMQSNVINVNSARSASYWQTISNGFDEKVAGILEDTAFLADLEGYLKICASLHQINPEALKRAFDKERASVVLPDCLMSN